jgi:hypothetical protein
MSELPAIVIQPTAENDLIVVLNALFSTRDTALLVSRPRVLLETYRAELNLLRDLLTCESDPAPEAPVAAAPEAAPILDGSILR